MCSSPAGNVIVSTDLCINPILGYSDTPIENMDSIPEGLQYLLDLYAKEHEFIVNSGYVNSSSNNNLPRKIESVTKGPLITTQWGQEEPYNNNCPTRNGTRCLTGCVATAMAQIMYYYKYPNDGTFDWDNMANTYNYNSYTDEQASAVAKLMRSCGSAVGMSYGTSVSTAYNERVNGALVSNFGYLSSIAYVERNKASSESWNELIMSEIDKLHPIYYSGKPDNNYNSTGHAFIVDGYQTNAYGNTLFHVNYGWDGYCDGYYSLGNLQGYNYYQEAYINIKTGNESLSNDGGVFQADKLYVSSSIFVKDKTTRMSLYLVDAEFRRYANIPSGEDVDLDAYFVNTTTNQKYHIATWSVSNMINTETGSYVYRNKSFTPTMPVGTYYVQFYSMNGSGKQIPITISNQRKLIDVVSTEITKEYVDLGLPSRTLWANLNLGAKRPEDVGFYYAWAETNGTKSQYITDTYKYYNSNGEWTKYNSNDGLTKLEACDDAVVASWGSDWVTPTYTQMSELVNKCTWTYTWQNGVKGYEVVGPNGNSIFIPFSGVLGSNYTEDDYCGYWTSSKSSNDNSARILRFNSSEVLSSYVGYREWGRPIRPVYAIPMISVNGIVLSQQSLQMTEGNVVTITATISPSNAFNKEVIWSSSNTDVATVSNGVITAISAGEAIITVTAADGSGVTSQCAVTVKLHEQKDLIYSEGYSDWTSSYKYDDCYESKTYSFYAEKGDEITFDWVTSSESGCDFLRVNLDGKSILSESGENSGNYSNTIESDGTHTLVVSWSKDYFESIGNDEVSVKNIFVNHYYSIYFKYNEKSLGSWTSTNHDDDSTDSKTINFVSEEGDILNFDYYISSEDDYDIGYVYLDGECIISVSGYSSSTFRRSLGSGSHTIIYKYVKDGSESNWSDYFSISNINITYKDIVSSIGLNSVPLSSDVKSIQIYKEYDAPCSYTFDTNNMKWQSLILPFELSYTDWYDKVEIAEIDSIVAVYDSDGITVLDIDMYTTIIDKGTIVPNKPYLVRNLQNTSVTLSNDYAKLKKNSNNIHSYTYANVVASVCPVYSQLNSNNYWVVDNELSKTNRIMNVFHWYMKLTDKNSGNILNFSNSIDIHVQYPLRGDVNCDGEVDVVDVVDIARYVVGTPAETFVEILADINRDGSVNIGDAVALVNEIAGDQNFVKAMRAPSRTAESEDVLSLTQTDEGLALVLANQRDYTAFQFDLFVPEGTDVAQMLLNAERKQKHQLLYNKVEEGLYRVAALSTSNRTFQGNDGELLSFALDSDSDSDIAIRNIHFFDTEGGDYMFCDLQSSSATEISSLKEEQTTTRPHGTYDLQGRKVETMSHGIYIVNGKKVIIK